MFESEPLNCFLKDHLDFNKHNFDYNNFTDKFGDENSFKNLKQAHFISKDTQNNLQSNLINVYLNKKGLTRFSSHEDDQMINLQESYQLIDLFFGNKFEKLKTTFKEYQNSTLNSLYLKYTKTILSFIEAIVIKDEYSIENAQKILKETSEFCNKRRPKKRITFFNSNLPATKVNYFSEQEIHAELCNADCQLLILLLSSIFNGKNNLDLIHNTVKLKTCLNDYKFCYEILQKRTLFQNEDTRKEFKYGILFGLGIIHMLVQELPLNMQFSAKIELEPNLDFELALNDVSSQTNLRQMLSIILQTVYKIDRFATSGECQNLYNCKNLLGYAFENYSEACIILYLDGKIKYLTKQHASAISQFELCLASSNLLRSLQYHCEYNMAICFALQQNWLKAAEASLFLANSFQKIYSPLVTQYMYIVFMKMHFFYLNYNLYKETEFFYLNNTENDFKMQSIYSNTSNSSNNSIRTGRSQSESLTTSRTNSMTDSLNIINQNYENDTWHKLDNLPEVFENTDKNVFKSTEEYLRLEQMTEEQFEKIMKNHFEYMASYKNFKNKELSYIESLCIINANKYLKTGRLILPAFELFYWMSLFNNFDENKNLVTSILKSIEIELIEEDELKDEPEADMDNFSLLYFLKGVCLTEIQRYDQAIKCFKEILYCEKRIKNDKHILYFCLIELPFVLIKNSKQLEAFYYLDKQKELCGTELNKVFRQSLTSSISFKKMLNKKNLQLQNEIAKISNQGTTQNKITKQRNSIAAFHISSTSYTNLHRPSTNHLKQLFKQRTISNISTFKDELLEANLAKKYNQNKRSSLSVFFKNSIFGG